MSRPLVREALRTLVTHGLIEIAPGRGAFVRAASSAHAARPLQTLYRRRQVTPRHLVETRLMLEPSAVSLACERAEEDEIEALTLAIDRFDRATGALEMARWDLTTHALIARMSHNPVIETTFGSVASLIFDLMLRSLRRSKRAAPRSALPSRHCRGDPRTRRRGRPQGDGRAPERRPPHLRCRPRQEPRLRRRRELQRLLGPAATLESILENVAIARRPLDTLETQEILGV